MISMSDSCLDPRRIREDFPILQRKIAGHPIVYLDNAATTHKPTQVIDAISDYYRFTNSNVHRGVHTLSIEATEAYEDARSKVQRFINAPSSESVIWTRNTTESLNLVARSWGDANVRSGDNIVTTAMEHHSDIVPWQQLALRKGAELRFLPVGEEGRLDMSYAETMIDDKTRIVSASHMSNVLGCVNPIKELARQAHAHGAVMVVDGAQSVPHFPIDVQTLECDFMAFSGHKMLGPTGIGVLYGSTELLEEMPPFLFGGDMILEVTYESASWNSLPYKFEAGTPDIAGAIGLGAAVDYLNSLGMENVWLHEKRLGEYTLECFQDMNRFRIMGPLSMENRGGVISFIHEDIHPHDIGTALDSIGIAIRTGHHCAMPLVHSYGVVAAARSSSYIYNTEEDIDALIAGLKRAEAYFLK